MLRDGRIDYREQVWWHLSCLVSSKRLRLTTTWKPELQPTITWRETCRTWKGRTREWPSMNNVSFISGYYPVHLRAFKLWSSHWSLLLLPEVWSKVLFLDHCFNNLHFERHPLPNFFVASRTYYNVDIWIDNVSMYHQGTEDFYISDTLNCSFRGSLLTRSLADIVKKEDFVLDSEYLITMLVVVPK